MRHGPQTLTFRFLLLLSFTALLVFPARGISFGISTKLSPSGHAIQDDALRDALEALQDNRLDDALTALTAAEREHPQDARIRNFRGKSYRVATKH